MLLSPSSSVPARAGSLRRPLWDKIGIVFADWKYNKIQFKTYLQKTVGRNCFCSVWKSFSLSSLGSTFAVTLVENLGHSKYYHCGCRCLRLKYRQSLFHCYNHFLSPLMFGYGNVGWAIKVDCRWIDSRYIDYRHIAKYWFVDMSTVYLSQDSHQ